MLMPFSPQKVRLILVMEMTQSLTLPREAREFLAGTAL